MKKSLLGLGAVLLFAGLASSAVRAEDQDVQIKAGDSQPTGKAYVEKIPGTDITYKMVPIPAGKFMMGSSPKEAVKKPEEMPQHEVQVDAFWMGECVVTQPEYSEFLAQYSKLAAAAPPPIPVDKIADAVTYPTPMYELEAGPKLQAMGRGKGFPAVIMSPYAAKQYTKWLSKKTGHFYRLPTEAEWEYACRAGTTTAYSFGDDPKQLPDYSWDIDNSTIGNGDPQYHPVKSKKPNPWGLYGMHGNVAQWVIDAYDPDWYKQFEGKTTNWHDTINWPTKQYPRVIRGGSYQSDPEDCRSASRFKATEDLNQKDPQLPKSPHWMSDAFWVGFRIISPVKEPSEQEKHKFWEVDNEYTKKVLTRDRELRDIPALGGK